MSNNSLFQKPWWLDAVAPEQWKEVTVENKSAVLARLPYVIKKRRGFTLLTQPQLTQTLGPWLRPSKAKYAKQLSEQKDLMTELIQKLPPFDYFSHNFHYSITNWLPFYWQGFEQTTRYTYVLENLTDIGKVWDGMMPNIRTDIKKAQYRYDLQIRTDLSLDKFLDVNELTFTGKGEKPPYTRNFVHRLDNACKAHNASKMFFAQDNEDKIHAAVYIVWDENSAYYIMGGGNPILRNSGATSLCIWEAIKFSSTVTQKFDFEGSMIEPVERFFRAFGAKQMPYLRISKTNSRLLKLLKALT
jgi:Acetyltransferase (GNAT) domain